jgi:hypothetical protein
VTMIAAAEYVRSRRVAERRSKARSRMPQSMPAARVFYQQLTDRRRSVRRARAGAVRSA